MNPIKPTPLLAALLALCAPAAALAQNATSSWDRNVERMDYLTNPPERGDNNFFTTVVAQTGNVTLLYPAKNSLKEFSQRLYRIRVDLGGLTPTRCDNAYLNALTYFMPTNVNAPAGQAAMQGVFDPLKSYPDPETTYSGGGGVSNNFANASFYLYGNWPVGSNPAGTAQTAAAACGALKDAAGLPLAGQDLADCTKCTAGAGVSTKKQQGYYLNPYAKDNDVTTNAGVFAGQFLNFHPPKWSLLRLAYKRLVNGPLLSVLREAVVAQNGAVGGTVVQKMLPQSCQGQGRPLNQKLGAADALAYTSNANPIAEMMFNTAWYMGGQENPWWFGAGTTPGAAMVNGKSGPCNGCNADFMVVFSDGRGDIANPSCTPNILGVKPAFCTATAACTTVGMGTADDGNDFLNPNTQLDVAATITGLGVRQTWPGTCDMDFADDVATWMVNNDVSFGTAGTRVQTYVVGIGDPKNTYGEMSILQGIASKGGGIYTVADDYRTLEVNIEQVFLDIIRRATSFSVAAITTVQTRGSTFAFIPRFRPLQGPQWEGRLLRFKLFNEFAAGCDISVDKNVKNAVNPNGNASCNDLYLQDKNNKYIAESADAGVNASSFFTLDNAQPWNPAVTTGWPFAAGVDGGLVPATPVWEAEQELETRVTSFIAGAADDRLIYTVAANASGGYDPALISFNTSNVSTITPLLKLGGYLGDFCSSLAGMTRHTYATDDDCTVDVIQFMRGYDVMLQNGLNRAGPDGGSVVKYPRPNVMGDIFHSSPILVTPPVPSGLCSLGLSNQCLLSLYTDNMTPEAPTSPSFRHAYDEYQAKNDHRTEIVVVGANDGMLHAFNAGNWVTGDDPDTPLITETAHYDLGTGKEMWAFIPPDLLPKLQRYIINTRHEAMVDGTPMVRDIWVDGSGAASTKDGKRQSDEFHTVAVVAEREGGRHHFALDISDPAVPKYLWSYPLPGTAEALNSGESWNDVAPGAPPIVNIVVADSTGPVNRGGSRASEKWVIGIGGGFDTDLLRGRGIHVLDAWTGQEVFRFSRADSTGATDPRQNLFPVASSLSFVDTDQDFVFDTVTFGDTFGQLWAINIAAPGRDNTGDGMYDNWFGGRAFVEFKGSPLWHRAPFFQRPAMAVVPQPGGQPIVRALLGSGNRDQIKDGQGGTCGLSDLDACLRQDCTVDVLASRRRIGPAPLGGAGGHYQTGEWKYTSGSTSLTTNTLNLTPGDTQSSASTDVDDVSIQYTLTCGGTTQTHDNSIYCDFSTGECPPDVGKPLGTKLIWTPSVAQEYSRFYSVQVWGTGNRAAPTTLAAAQTYDANALTDTNLVDATSCPLNATAGSCASATGNGWFVAHNQTVTLAGVTQARTPGDEKTGSSALVLAGCALWNTLLPNNSAVLACNGTLPADNAFVYQGDALTGHLQCGVAGSATASATVRAVRRDTNVTPQQFTPVVSLNQKTGDVAYSGVSLEPGAPPLQVQVGGNNVIGFVKWLEVSRATHDCRHSGKCQ
jgi:type IV pilus assembly protein PilY1